MEKLKLVSTGSSDRTGQSDIEGSSVRRGESILSGEQTVEQAYNELRDEYKVTAVDCLAVIDYDTLVSSSSAAAADLPSLHSSALLWVWMWV